MSCLWKTLSGSYLCFYHYVFAFDCQDCCVLSTTAAVILFYRYYKWTEYFFNKPDLFELSISITVLFLHSFVRLYSVIRLSRMSQLNSMSWPFRRHSHCMRITSLSLLNSILPNFSLLSLPRAPSIVHNTFLLLSSPTNAISATITFADSPFPVHITCS